MIDRNIQLMPIIKNINAIQGTSVCMFVCFTHGCQTSEGCQDCSEPGNAGGCAWLPPSGGTPPPLDPTSYPSCCVSWHARVLTWRETTAPAHKNHTQWTLYKISTVEYCTFKPLYGNAIGSTTTCSHMYSARFMIFKRGFHAVLLWAMIISLHMCRKVLQSCVGTWLLLASQTRFLELCDLEYWIYCITPVVQRTRC